MKIDKETFKRKTFYGIPVSEILGIVILIIPVIISITFHKNGTILGFIPWKNKNLSLKPGLVSSLCASAFYLALIVRYDFFRKDDLGLSLISTIQAVLNIWVLSSMIAIIVPADSYAVPEILIFGVVFSWLGMKTIAGYSWIIFVIAAVKNLGQMNAAMDWIGAAYIIPIAISMLLQVNHLSDIKTFIEDFKSPAKAFASSARDEIGIAAEDASERIHRVFDDTADSLRMNDLSRVAAAGEEKPRKKNKEDIE